MARKLPPLKSLASFEAAARHRSFTKAAQELHVTQSAISHQVKALEDNLDVRLFNRDNRQLSLTRAGKALLPEVSESLNKLALITRQLRQRPSHDANILSVRVAPSLALAWLAPRLGDFWQKYPEIELCLYHSHAPTDFDVENIDMSITYGKGNWPGVTSIELMKLDFFPVCSPKLLEGSNLMTDINELKNHTLLHEIDYQCWADWLALANVNQVNPYHGSIIDDTNVLVQAAIDGKGVALGSSIFVDKYLADGRLVRLSSETLKNDDSYYIAFPKQQPPSPLMNSFTDWLLSQEA